MKYENTIYLKNGSNIVQKSDENLADKLSFRKDWNVGTLLLNSNNKTVVPVSFIACIDTKEVESK